MARDGRGGGGGIQEELARLTMGLWRGRNNPKCDNGRAYFYQLQIRSADEPMTTCAFSLGIFTYFHFCTNTFVQS